MSAVNKLLKIASRFERIIKSAQKPNDPYYDLRVKNKSHGLAEDINFSTEDTRTLQDLMNKYFKSKNMNMAVKVNGEMNDETLRAIEYAKNNIQSDGGGVMYSAKQVLTYLQNNMPGVSKAAQRAMFNRFERSIKLAQETTDSFNNDRQKVLKLQTLMNNYFKSHDMNNMLLTADGVMGPKTKEAMKYFNYQKGKTFTGQQLLDYLSGTNDQHKPKYLSYQLDIESPLFPGYPLAKREPNPTYEIPLPKRPGES